jgi:predicted GIY-YIG superfamily endonuclease
MRDSSLFHLSAQAATIGAEGESAMHFWVYILRCADGSYYIGHTDDIDKRLAGHDQGAVSSYTRKRRPVKLVFAEEFATRIDAMERERQLKGWSRAKKEALIAGNWVRLRALARNLY